MTITRSPSLLALAASLALLASPAFAQQNQPMQDNSCSELIRVLQRTQRTANMPVSLDQARTYRDNNDLASCRQALANLAQQAHNRAGVSANVTPRDFRQGGQTGRLHFSGRFTWRTYPAIASRQKRAGTASVTGGSNIVGGRRRTATFEGMGPTFARPISAGRKLTSSARVGKSGIEATRQKPRRVASTDVAAEIGDT